jgi:hypothetical protein
MANKELTIPVIQDAASGQAAKKANDISNKASSLLDKVWAYFTGADEKEAPAPDLAAPIIAEIEDAQVATIVKELHYRTPKSLKAMRDACQKCFVLPEDCPYWDYSIFDVKKAMKRLKAHPENTYNQVVVELKRVNEELAHHIYESLDEDD